MADEFPNVLASGRRNGRLSVWHPADLGSFILDAIVDLAGIDPAAIEWPIPDVKQITFSVSRPSMAPVSPQPKTSS